MKRFNEAEALLLDSLNAYEKTLGGDAEKYGDALNNLGSVYYETGRYLEAKEMYGKALKICRNRLGFDNPKTVAFENNLKMTEKKIAPDN